MQGDSQTKVQRMSNGSLWIVVCGRQWRSSNIAQKPIDIGRRKSNVGWTSWCNNNGDATALERGTLRRSNNGGAIAHNGGAIARIIRMLQARVTGMLQARVVATL